LPAFIVGFFKEQNHQPVSLYLNWIWMYILAVYVYPSARYLKHWFGWIKRYRYGGSNVAILVENGKMYRIPAGFVNGKSEIQSTKSGTIMIIARNEMFKDITLYFSKSKRGER
jgi:hypothetical protein